MHDEVNGLEDDFKHGPVPGGEKKTFKQRGKSASGAMSMGMLPKAKYGSVKQNQVF